METLTTVHKWTHPPLLFLTIFTAFLFISPVNGFSWNTIACQLFECCDKPYISFNAAFLVAQLSNQVYGQHLVLDIVKTHLQAHFDDQYIPPKPLVLSFHGGTGTGKNHVARIIVNSIYKKGMSSQFVHYYHSSKRFPHAHKLDEYGSLLQKEIENEVYRCNRAVFIFDEFDHMPEGLIDRIKFYLDFYENVEGIDYRRSMFIFLSNSGTELINEHVAIHHQQGRKREDISLFQLEEQVSKKAMTTKGGFYDSRLIDRELITAYVPFLPLQRQHVSQCVKNELSKRHISVSEDLVLKVLEQLQFVDGFSVSGCKRVAEKVAYAIIKFRHHEL